MLARREHSRAELAARLATEGSAEEINRMLSELEAEGLLSDARFAEAYVRSHGARQGRARLQQALRQRGVAADVAAPPLAALASELDRARDVWQRKFSILPTDRREWARQARFLQGRGFATDVIRQLLKDPEA